MSNPKQWIAPGRAIFFCVIALVFLSFLVISSISCNHTPDRSPKGSALESDGNPVDKKVGGVKAENDLLREENERLRLEIIRLNAELAKASETIYTLNRKLDAIFNPDVMGE